MHFYKHLIPICCFLVLFNCKEEHNTVFSEINITSEHNTTVEINIPHASGDKTVSNQINSEIQNKIISSLHIGNLDEITSTSVEESILTFNNEFEAFKTDFPETDQIWEAQIDGEVLYQSQDFICIAITSYINTGGAHGVLNISFLNFDSKTGQRIQNNQLFNDSEAFKAVAETYFKDATDDEGVLLNDTQFELPTNIGYSEDGIVLLYNTYDIAPYSSGIIEFAIPFEVVEPYLVFNGL